MIKLFQSLFLTITLTTWNLPLAFAVSGHSLPIKPGFYGNLVNWHDHGGDGVSNHSVKVNSTGFFFTDHTN
jgi:hypothetical protein